MSNELRIAFESEPSDADEAFVRHELGQWNMRATGLHDYAPANFFIRDAEKRIRGAVLAYVWGRWLHVDILWLADDIRGRGWGTKLLEAAHAAGRASGAQSAWLDTFSWQARPFYERLGYEVVFEVPDFPPGNSRIFMRKTPL